MTDDIPEIEFRGTNHLRTNGHLLGSFDGPIVEVRYIGTKCLVAFDYRAEHQRWNRNIICVSKEDIVWEIAKTPTQNGDSDRWIGTELEDGEVWAIPEQGAKEYRIDLETGEIVESRAR